MVLHGYQGEERVMTSLLLPFFAGESKAPPPVLYMVGDTLDYLITLDPETGVGTRVGTETNFGVSNSFLLNRVRYLSLLGTDVDLYMSGEFWSSTFAGTFTYYYTQLNRTTGAVISNTYLTPDARFPDGVGINAMGNVGNTGYTIIGSRRTDTASLVSFTTSTFGDQTVIATDEDYFQIYGMTGHKGSLYGVRRDTSASYLVDIDLITGTMTRVGNSDNFGVGELLPNGLASDGVNLYMVGLTNQVLYVVDEDTGIGTRRGTATAFGLGETAPGGLAVVGVAVAPEPEPEPEPGESITFTLNAATINAVAAGVFSGLRQRFTLGGREYIISGLFTHGNGVQFRFERQINVGIFIADNASAQAFIAADFKVDVGIAGQQPFQTSVMDNISGISAAQYRAFPGRFVGGTSYTITITESS